MANTDSKTPSHASNVYLFKNGYGMFVKTFDLPPNKNNIDTPVELIDPPLNPVHGTFWIQPFSDKTSISSTRTKKTRKFVNKECFSVEDLVEANVGQDVQLLVIDAITKTKEWISGRIKSVKRTQEQVSDNEDTDITDPTTNTQYHQSTTIAHSSTIQTGNLVLFETTDTGLQALSLSSIQSIRGPTLKTTYQQKTRKNCLLINYKNESDSNDTGLMKYLTFGITWAPSYNLVILSSENPSIKKLRLTSKAVILNDIENINVDNLFCIVGFPNISKFASVIDPIISGKNVQEFLDHLKQCENGSGVGVGRMPQFAQQSIMSNSIMTQSMRAPISFDNNVPDNTQQDTNVDDLHLYEFKNILLKKKERLMLPIFDIEISYKDIYHCKINGLQSEYIYSGYDEKKPYEEVWHSVEFENTSNFVWTTAPVVVTKGQHEQQFIGQDTLTYTLKGSTTFVNLTKALDVRVQLDEKVTSTNQAGFVRFRVKYQTDEIEGTITITNYKSEEVVVVINATLAGKISKYTIAPKKDSIKVNEVVANQPHDIRWEVNVKPQQKLEMKYTRLYNKQV